MTNTKTVEAGERTHTDSGEYLAANKSVSIYKPDIHPIEKMVRLYCTMCATSWKLQIRGPMGIGCNGTRQGKSSVIANAELDLKGMISLRDAINEFVTEAQLARSKAEGRAQ